MSKIDASRRALFFISGFTSVNCEIEFYYIIFVKKGIVCFLFWVKLSRIDWVSRWYEQEKKVKHLYYLLSNFAVRNPRTTIYRNAPHLQPFAGNPLNANFLFHAFYFTVYLLQHMLKRFSSLSLSVDCCIWLRIHLRESHCKMWMDDSINEFWIVMSSNPIQDILSMCFNRKNMVSMLQQN